MNKVQISACLVFLAFCCFNLTTSLNCYICDSSLGQNCTYPTNIQTCNDTLAKSTFNYGLSFTNASFQQLNVTSASFACVSDYIVSANSASNHYLGCAYNNLELCSFGTRLPHLNRTCSICTRDKCNFMNPADRAVGSFFTITTAVALACLGKYLSF